MSEFLVVKNLKRFFLSGYGNNLEVLKDINFVATKASTTAIIGPSGSGKSVLLQLIGGLDHPNSGECLLNEVNIFKLDSQSLANLRNRKIGFVFQSNQLLPDFSALENVFLPAFVKLGDIKKAKLMAEEQLVQMGLGERLNYKVTQLSGGEQQRVAIARALVNNPDLILADEPTGSLDYDTGSKIIDILLKRVTTTKTTLILVTHNLELAKLMNNILRIRDGKIHREKID